MGSHVSAMNRHEKHIANMGTNFRRLVNFNVTFYVAGISLSSRDHIRRLPKQDECLRTNIVRTIRMLRSLNDVGEGRIK